MLFGAALVSLASQGRGAIGQERFTTLAPPGPFALGRVERRLVGPAPAIITYPAAEATPRTPARGPRPPTGRAENLTRRFGEPAARELMDGLGWAQEGAATASGRHPVLVFAPGMRLAAFDYRTISEWLASAGYVVVAITPAGNADYSDAARDIAVACAAARRWANEPGDNLGAAIDAAAMGVFGHSLGGAAAALAASRDASLRAVANLDGDFAGAANAARPRQPLLYLTSEDDFEAQRSRERRARVWRNVSALSRSASAIRLSGFKHLDFLDAFLVASRMPAETREARFGRGPAEGALALSANLVRSFFDDHLRGQSGALAATLASGAGARSIYSR